MARRIRGAQIASVAFVERDREGKPITFYAMGLPPPPMPPRPRFDGGDGGDEDDGETQPIEYLRAMFAANQRATAADFMFGSYSYAFEIRGSALARVTRIPTPEHDPGDEDRWLEVTHAELIAALIGTGSPALK